MITEQELKEQCTLDIIKRMVELAEGFEYQGDDEIFYNSLRVDRNILLFPLLIHRAVEGMKIIYSDPEKLWYNNTYGMQCFRFKNYQPESLTHAECAILDCLIDILKDEKNF